MFIMILLASVLFWLIIHGCSNTFEKYVDSKVDGYAEREQKKQDEWHNALFNSTITHETR